MNDPLFLAFSQLPAVDTVIKMMKKGRIASTSKMFIMLLQKVNFEGVAIIRKMNSIVNHVTQTDSIIKKTSP